ncbi:serine/threonine-protein kinase [Mycobacterium vicinigordonae]|uniref:non-specific serine/threonine protein kinase n=1 Tax=Mycobacterium vicinigordonae TaxID=1719132 RepID=A0A7D6I4I9_9MYCO|nr:serine/threonine-protein kinase [Mycobacterium vicinigordonae]QLL05636.1 serine/threonine protein kinase [Mycobacterium vicinigordonae]
MSSPDHGSRTGTQFGPYELRSLIGRGEVYEAYDTRKDQAVAIRFLPTDFAANPGLQQRLSRVAAMSDPHVLPVYHFGEISGVPYLDTRLVDGGTLRDLLLEQGTLEPPRAARIIAQVAAALDAAHAKGLVHGDVKPENVLLTPDDFAYLDFGGGAAGSTSYLAPERLGGSRIGPPSDIYSLTCVLYECLTGRPPFEHDEEREVLNAHIFGAPPRPSIMRRAVNRDFDGIIARGMAKQPAARFVSAAELASAAGEAALWDQPLLASGPPLHERSKSERPKSPKSEPPKTRPFQVVHESASKPPAVSRVVLSGVTAALFVIAVTLAGVLALTDHRHTPAVAASAPSAAPPVTPTTEATPSLSHPVQGADALGFIGHPARCDPGNPPAAVVRTAKSLAVVCQSKAGYYYRGERIRDGANIEISNAVRTAGGFDVINPANGVRYEVRPHQLTILSGQHVDSAEPVLQYASAA